MRDLDRMMGGLQASDLVIIAGRPGMGKTALATNIAFNIAKAYEFRQKPDGSHETINGGIVGFFSLEMSSDQLATRMIAEQSQVPSYKIRRGDITEHEFHRVAEAAREMQQIPFYIDHTGGISIAQLVARARRLKRQRGLDMLVVDYLQLLSGSKSKGDNRVQELTEITTGLKALAKELAVPVVALSQLSRQVESRDDKRPAAFGPARIRFDRAGRRRRLSSSIARNTTCKNKEPRARQRTNILTWQSDMERGARQGRRSSLASSATDRQGPWNSPSRRS